VFQISCNVCNYYPYKIGDEEEKGTNDSKSSPVNIFYNPSKKVQGQHVENEVRPIVVNKTRAQKPVVLSAFVHCVWIENPPLQYLWFVPGVHSGYNRDGNNAQCYSFSHFLLFFPAN
jgi:hypothetical protein